jgi:hypothetical protein
MLHLLVGELSCIWNSLLACFIVMKFICWLLKLKYKP